MKKNNRVLAQDENTDYGNQWNQDTSVGPEDNIIFIRITPALKEVEEQVSSLNINIPSERTENIEKLQQASTSTTLTTYLTVSSQNDVFLILTPYRGNAGCPSVVNSDSESIERSSTGLKRP